MAIKDFFSKLFKKGDAKVTEEPPVKEESSKKLFSKKNKDEKIDETTEINNEKKIRNPLKKEKAIDEPITEENENGLKEKLKNKISEEKTDKPEKPKEESIRTELKEMFSRVIEPEERTIKNYLSIDFWKTKRLKYDKIKEKEIQDLNVYGVLSEGATPTIEYYILTILSCIIATTGLIQDSSATIIGAMIVAPLMTPILAFSLGVIWGDIQLIKTSLSSIAKGTGWAIGISALIALVVPLPGLSHEILSRTTPSLFDIIVAISSGIVGAYGYANKKISNTIVGIAIAVALMPPLCSVGIGIGTFNQSVAVGALLLFLINLVSISLAGAFIFWTMKIHPFEADQSQVKRRALSQIAISLVVLAAIAIPLGIFMYEGYIATDAENNIRQIVKNDYPSLSIYSIKNKRFDDGIKFDIVLTGKEIPDKGILEKTKKNFMKKYPHITKVRVRFMKSEILTE